MENPLEALSPVDQHYRGVILEHKGRYVEAEEVYRKAKEGLYTAESIRCLESQLDYVIEEPGVLLEELRRIVSVRFMAISNFYPEDDKANGKIIREAGLEKLLYRSSALKEFKKAGWNTSVENSCTGEVRPAPPGVVLEGARVDALPACRTDLEWCVISAV